MLLPVIHFASAETVLLTPDLHPRISTVLTFGFRKINLLYVFNFFLSVKGCLKSDKYIERC